MSAGRSLPAQGAAALGWRKMAIAAACLGCLVLAGVLGAPASTCPSEAAALPQAPAMAVVEAPRTRLLRHGGSGPAWVIEH